MIMHLQIMYLHAKKYIFINDNTLINGYTFIYDNLLIYDNTCYNK